MTFLIFAKKNMHLIGHYKRRCYGEGMRNSKSFITRQNIIAHALPFVGLHYWINEIHISMFWSTVLHKLNTDFQNAQYGVQNYCPPSSTMLNTEWNITALRLPWCADLRIENRANDHETMRLRRITGCEQLEYVDIIFVSDTMVMLKSTMIHKLPSKTP